MSFFVTTTIIKRGLSVFTRDAVESFLVANYKTPNHIPAATTPKL